MICGGHAGRAHRKILELRQKIKKASQQMMHKYKDSYPELGKLTCKCMRAGKSNHSANCGCLTASFISRAHTNFTSILMAAQSKEEFVKRLEALPKHNVFLILFLFKLRFKNYGCPNVTVTKYFISIIVRFSIRCNYSVPLSVNHAVILMHAVNATLDRSGDLNIFIIVCVKTTSTAKNAIYTKKCCSIGRPQWSVIHVCMLRYIGRHALERS